MEFNKDKLRIKFNYNDNGYRVEYGFTYELRQIKISGEFAMTHNEPQLWITDITKGDIKATIKHEDLYKLTTDIKRYCCTKVLGSLGKLESEVL